MTCHAVDDNASPIETLRDTPLRVLSATFVVTTGAARVPPKPREGADAPDDVAPHDRSSDYGA